MARPKQSHHASDVGRLLDRLSADEPAFLRREFLAPSIGTAVAQVRIGGVLCRLKTEPADFTGWGVFQPTSFTSARLVRQASLAERRRYLDLLPLVRLIVCGRDRERWLGSAASWGDRRFEIEGLVPLELAEEIQLFELVRARYDGTTFWFDESDPRHDPGAAAYLRKALNDRVAPDTLQRPGLTGEERAAYELNYWLQVRPVTEQDAAAREQSDSPARRQRRAHQRRHSERRDIDPVRERLRASLSHAGAQLVEYLERGDSYRVTYAIGRQQYVSSVTKGDLTVHVAGICLSGEDAKFDLNSLVGVLREAHGGGVVRVGAENNGMSEDDYWRVHPRRNR